MGRKWIWYLYSELARNIIFKVLNYMSRYILQVTKDLQKEGHPRRLQSSAGQHQALIMQPLVVQHYAQNVHTEVQLGLAPPLSGGGSTGGGGSGGGFFGSVSKNIGEKWEQHKKEKVGKKCFFSDSHIFETAEVVCVSVGSVQLNVMGSSFLRLLLISRTFQSVFHNLISYSDMLFSYSNWDQPTDFQNLHLPFYTVCFT